MSSATYQEKHCFPWCGQSASLHLLLLLFTSLTHTHTHTQTHTHTHYHKLKCKQTALTCPCVSVKWLCKHDKLFPNIITSADSRMICSLYAETKTQRRCSASVFSMSIISIISISLLFQMLHFLPCSPHVLELPVITGGISTFVQIWGILSKPLSLAKTQFCFFFSLFFFFKFAFSPSLDSPKHEIKLLLPPCWRFIWSCLYFSLL